MIRALIFDFDGLILETEGPIFESFQELYRAYGQTLDIQDWAQYIGTAEPEFDPQIALEMKIGGPLPQTDLVARAEREKQLLASQPILPGVVDYLEDAQRLGLKVGLASSSPCEWVTGHLERLGLISYFSVILASDDVHRTKPDPELYLSALRALEVQPWEAFALEDSPNGIWAARQAGLFCVAVPNPLTRQLDTSHADLHLDSLASLPLERLLVVIESALAG